MDAIVPESVSAGAAGDAVIKLERFTRGGGGVARVAPKVGRVISSTVVNPVTGRSEFSKLRPVVVSELLRAPARGQKLKRASVRRRASRPTYTSRRRAPAKRRSVSRYGVRRFGASRSTSYRGASASRYRRRSYARRY